MLDIFLQIRDMVEVLTIERKWREIDQYFIYFKISEERVRRF